MNYVILLGVGLVEIELSDISPVLNRLQVAEIDLFRTPKGNWYDVGETLSGQSEFIVQDLDGYLLRHFPISWRKIQIISLKNKFNLSTMSVKDVVVFFEGFPNNNIGVEIINIYGQICDRASQLIKFK